MKNKNTVTILLLLLLTAITALVSHYFSDLKWLVIIILGLSTIKFALVAFQFVELKKAHTVWKTLIIGYLAFFFSTVSLILI